MKKINPSFQAILISAADLKADIEKEVEAATGHKMDLHLEHMHIEKEWHYGYVCAINESTTPSESVDELHDKWGYPTEMNTDLLEHFIEVTYGIKPSNIITRLTEKNELFFQIEFPIKPDFYKTRTSNKGEVVIQVEVPLK